MSLDDTDESPSCGHEDALRFALNQLVIASYFVDKDGAGKSAEENLGMLMNAVGGIVYEICQYLQIESLLMEAPDGQAFQVIPTKIDVPPKSKSN
jgi:hypothetical protein